MRILQISESGTVGTPDAGPVSSVTTHLANALVNEGHDVGLVDRSGARRSDLDARVKTWEVPLRPPSLSVGRRIIPPAIARVRESASLMKRASACVAQFQPDLVHVHDVSLALVYGRRYPGPVLWTCHGMNWTMEPAGVSRRPRALLNRLLELLACRIVEHTVVLNTQTYRALGKQRVSVIPNGVDLRRWQTIEQSAARRSLGLSPDTFTVTFVGRIAPSKGVHVYVQAVEMAARRIQLQSQAVGSLGGEFGNTTNVTPYAARVIKEGPSTRFLGFIHRDQPEYAKRLAASDVVVVPSITEPFGLVVLEALACGSRVIGSDVGGIRDVLGGGVGVLVPPGVPEALAAAIVTAARDRQAGRIDSCRTDLRRHDWRAVSRAYARLAQELVHRADAEAESAAT